MVGGGGGHHSCVEHFPGIDQPQIIHDKRRSSVPRGCAPVHDVEDVVERGARSRWNRGEVPQQNALRSH